MATTWSGKVDAKAESGVKTGFVVKNGDVISIVASGWVSYGPSDSYMVGPQGMEGYHKDTLVYPQACGGALLVNIGGALYPVETGKLFWPAPADGELVFLINDDPGRYGDNSGEFDVTVKLEQNQSVSPPPPPPPPPAPRQWSGVVPANLESGMPTGLALKQGDLLSVAATGWVTFGSDAPYLLSPQGLKDYSLNSSMKYPGAWVGALLMRIGNDLYPVNMGMLYWEVPTDGELFFLINDQSGQYANNTGSFNVQVRVDQAKNSQVQSAVVAATQEQGQPTGVMVKQGQSYSIVGSGWATYGSSAEGPLSPQGQEGYNAGVICPSAWAGALLAKVGNSVQAFGGATLDWKPPIDGELVFVVNDQAGQYANNTGAFQVQFMPNLPPSPPPPPPPPVDNTKHWSGKVAATLPKPGQATGLTLKKGDSLSVVASGFVTLDAKDGSHPLGPQGEQGNKAKSGALMMAIGGQSYPAYTGVLDWTVPADGDLSFYVQDNYNLDNAGAFDVVARVTPVAA